MVNPELEEIDYSKNPDQHLYEFWASLDETERANAKRIAAELTQKRDLEPTVVIIPVAAHQEAGLIHHTLSQYAAQRDNVPFSIVLGLNTPTNDPSPETTQATVTAVSKATDEFPNLSVHTTFSTYDTPIIGGVRRDIWNGVLAASRPSWLSRHQEVIGINHDIDLEYLSPHYIAQIQRYYGIADMNRAYRLLDLPGQTHEPTFTMAKHARSPQHPNISDGVFWIDFCNRAAKSSFEAATVVPFSFYAAAGGFRPEHITYESQSLMRGVRWPLIPGAHIATSPRRYIERFAEHGYKGIWSDDSFSATDTCRNPQDIIPDISRNHLGDNIAASLYNQIDGHLLIPAINDALWQYESDAHRRGIQRELTRDELAPVLLATVTKRLCLSRAVLDRVIALPHLTEHFENLYAPDEIANGYLDDLFSPRDDAVPS